MVFIPKCRRKVLYQGIRQELRTVFRNLAEQWECKVEEGHLMPDYVQRLLSAPPKYSVPNVMGFIRGKSAIYIARVYVGRRRNFVGQHLCLVFSKMKKTTVKLNDSRWKPIK